jgi:NAD(P)-dependent dehydrogenase (short-subunit alcohol dehydrogenase family)
VNNAGVTRRADIMELTEEDWDRIHRVNAKGVFFCLQRVAREMIPRRSGRIINIASIAGKGCEGTSNAAYAASKGAVISLTKTAAQQLAKHDINVNSVCPGVTRTALPDANLRVRAQQEGVTRRRVAAIPLKRANDQRTSLRWLCSWRLPKPGTSPGNPLTWMEALSRIRCCDTGRLQMVTSLQTPDTTIRNRSPGEARMRHRPLSY